jgi:hypothetical protein
MSKIEIKSENVDAAYSVADTKTKIVLDALLGRNKKKVPTLDDYTTIKSYEDACTALGEPADVQFENIPDHIFALMKLETISRTLWGKNFQPMPDAEGNKIYYYPWFALYTQSEIDQINEENRGSLLAAPATHGAAAGFGYLLTHSRSSNSGAYIGFRLCQETEEKARYFGRQFIRIWAEYLKFNFEIVED